jgi:hypothetical protein
MWYLGHILSPGVTTDPKKLKAIWEWMTLGTSMNQGASLEYVPVTDSLSLALLTLWSCWLRLTEKKQAFQWPPEVDITFQSLKEVLYTAPVHNHEKSSLLTDAINVGIGAVLWQVQDSQERVIACYSKTVRNYCVTWWELLAIVRMLEHLRMYHYGQEFHLCTGHSTLTWLKSFKNLEGQMACWVQCSIQIHITEPSGWVAQQCWCPFLTTNARRSVLTAKKPRHWQT